MFNVISGWWTWLSGTNTVDQKGIYGTQGIADVQNRPSARNYHSMVMYPSEQLMFVFGGSGYGYDPISRYGKSLFIWTAFLVLFTR